MLLKAFFGLAVWYFEIIYTEIIMR